MSASGLIIIGSMMLAAEFIFGIAMVSKASRSEKANSAEKENDAGKKVIAATSAVMLTTLLGFGIAIACVGGKSGDKTEDSATGTVTGTTTETITTTVEETTEAATTTTTTTQTTTATETTTTTQTTTTTETTTTTTTTEPPTEAETVPLSEFEVVDKGDKGGFGWFQLSDGSIIIEEIITESLFQEMMEVEVAIGSCTYEEFEEMCGTNYTYEDIYGTDATNVIIPREITGHPVRGVSIGSLEHGLGYGWDRGIKSISVPKGMAFVSGTFDKEISFDEISTLLSQNGITLKVY